MTFGPITVGDILDLMDDCIQRAEERTEEFDSTQQDIVIELANSLNALANHFRSTPLTELTRRFPHVPDEVLVDPAGAHEGAPFPIFTGGALMTGHVLGARIPPQGQMLSGEVEESASDEEEP